MMDMNVLKKIYCRAYQEGFRIAMPFLPYKRPVILTDVTQIAGELEKRGLKKPMLVTDAGVMKARLTDSLRFAAKARVLFLLPVGSNVSPGSKVRQIPVNARSNSSMETFTSPLSGSFRKA